MNFDGCVILAHFEVRLESFIALELLTLLLQCFEKLLFSMQLYTLKWL